MTSRAPPAQRELLETIFDILEKSRPENPKLSSTCKTARQISIRIPESIRKLRDKGFIVLEETATGKVRTGSITPTSKAWEWRSRSRTPDSPRATDRTVLEQAETRDVRAYRAAGAGNAQYEDDGGDPNIPCCFLPTGSAEPDIFVAEVRGDSMAGDDLRSGQPRRRRPERGWKDGDMVVVLDQGALLVKRLWHEGDYILLKSSNPANAPIILEPGREHRRSGNQRQGNRSRPLAHQPAREASAFHLDNPAPGAPAPARVPHRDSPILLAPSTHHQGIRLRGPSPTRTGRMSWSTIGQPDNGEVRSVRLGHG